MALFPPFWHKLAYLSRIFLTGIAGAVCHAVFYAQPSVAADEVIVTYGAFEAVVPIADLETLATTGEASDALEFYLGLANLTPEDLRNLLVTELHVSHNLLDDMFNSEGGEYMLSEITQVVHTPSQQASVQALRSTLVLSANDDQKISLLELLQNYPTQQIYVDGINLIELAQTLSTERSTEEIPEIPEIPETPYENETDELNSPPSTSTEESLDELNSF